MATIQELDAQIADLKKEAADSDSSKAVVQFNKKIRTLQANRDSLAASDEELNAKIAQYQKEISDADGGKQVKSLNIEYAPLLAEQKRRTATATLSDPAATPAQKWAARQVISPTSIGDTDSEGNLINPADSDKLATANAHAAQNTPQWQAAVQAYNTGQEVAPEYVPLLNQLNSYFRGGVAAPGSLASTTAGEAIRQWGIDSQPGGFDKFMNVALPIAAGVLTGGVGGLGAVAGGAVAGGTSAGLNGGNLGDIAKGALTGGALAYGGGVLADAVGIGSSATNAGMADPGAAADTIASMGGAGGGVTGAMETAGMLSAAGADGVAASTAAGNVATGLGYGSLGTAATGAGATALGTVTDYGLGYDLLNGTTGGATTTQTTTNGIQQLTADQVASIANNPAAVAQYSAAGMIPTDLMSTLNTAGTTNWIDYLSTGLGVVEGISGILGGNDVNASASQNAVDPFAPYRAQYAEQLNQLMANPSSVTSLPGYQFQQQQGQQGVQRALAAQGRTVSGQEQLELQKYDQGLAGQAYNDQYNKLAQLSGANQGPGAGGTAFNQATAANQQANQTGWSQLGTLASGAMTPNTPINRAVTGIGDFVNSWR